jgi:phospholipase/carboxylesterase
MNRIQQLVDDEPVRSPCAELPAHLEEHDSRPWVGSDECHCLFAPKHYERNYAYPLVVWLHGPNDDERQVTRVMPLVSDRNYVAVGPRGTVAADPPGAGYRWVQQADEILRAEQRVMSAIAAARRWLNVSCERVFLAGYQQGGTMAYRIALARPHVFAGVLSFGGLFPTNLRPLANYPRARRVKIFFAAGREARQYSERDVARDLRLFHAAGMSVCLRLYPCGDELRTIMLADMDRWIMEQVAPQPALVDQHQHGSRRK